MRASRYFLQARQKASVGAQSPFHCMKGKGSLARTPQSKEVTPIWSGTLNSFYDSKNHWWTSVEPLSFCVAKTETNHGEELSPAWRFSRFQQVRSKTSAVKLNSHSPKMAIVGKDMQELNSTLSLPRGCAHTFGWAKQDDIHRLFSIQDPQSTALFQDRSSRAFPRAIHVFRINQETKAWFFQLEQMK